MARMSIDDMLGRDPRLARLALLLGWSKRETAGALVLDVWPLCYDRERNKLPIVDVDAAAGIEGFAEKMIEVGLAARIGSDQIRISGAKHRIEYLRKKQRAGSEGGRKSGESRRNQCEAKSKQTASTPQAPANPPSPDPVPDLAPASVPEPSQTGLAYDADDPRQRGSLALACWRELNERRAAIACELGQAFPLPLPIITPGNEPVGFRDLRDRIREEGASAPTVWVHILEALTAEARKIRSLEWLSDKSLGERAWRRARGLVPTWRTSDKQANDNRWDMPPISPLAEGLS